MLILHTGMTVFRSSGRNCSMTRLDQREKNNTRLKEIVYVNLHHLYSSSDIFGGINSRRVTWMGNIAQIQSPNVYRITEVIVNNV